MRCADEGADAAAVLAARLAHERAGREAQLRALWAMSPEQRAAAMWRTLRRGPGEPVELSWRQLWAWAARRPHEVPLVNGEFAFIAMATPEIADQ